MAAQTLSFLTNGDASGRYTALDEAVRSMVTSTFVQGRYRIEMPLEMPSGSVATVTVWPEGQGETFMVTDDGASLFELMAGAFNEHLFARVAKEAANDMARHSTEAPCFIFECRPRGCAE